MPNLVVEIGNTALKAAFVEGSTLGKTFRYHGEKRMDFIADLSAREKPEALTVASAAPVTPAEEERLRACCRRLILLDSAHTALQEEKGLPAYLSCDRAASLVAARHLFKGKSCTVMDFGTTLTVDFLSAEGEYLGGNISPGCRTRFKALNRYSRTLPLVDTPAETGLMGQSLRGSIEDGVISGIMFEITGYVDLYPENWVVFTGGDAIYFVKRMKNSIFVVCNLVLMGLALITDEYAEKTLQ